MLTSSLPFEERVAAILEEIRPSLRADGGNIDLVSVDEAAGRVEVRLTGACKHCPASTFTMAYAVEARLKQALPNIREVVAL
jgi:Fe-S cluster biogenesis protein NfuA